MKKELFILFSVLLLASCAGDDSTEKYQRNRNEIVDVKAKIQQIDLGALLIGPVADLYPINGYLLIYDLRSYDKLLHVFDMSTFKYLCSGIPKGRGPGEIVIPGSLMIDEAHRKFYAPDHGKLVIYGYELDKFIDDPDYKPATEMKMDQTIFPSDSQYIADDLLFGVMVEPIGTSNFKQSVAKWSMTTGEITRMPYKQPDIELRRIVYAVSVEDGLYAELYHFHDLMTICDLNGDLKCNIYGPRWDATPSKEYIYFRKALFCRDKIIAAYSGKKYDSDDWKPSKLLVFNLEGDYIKMLEVGYKISDFCYDGENNRLILSLDDEIQFAYLDLEGII